MEVWEVLVIDLPKAKIQALAVVIVSGKGAKYGFAPDRIEAISYLIARKTSPDHF